MVSLVGLDEMPLCVVGSTNHLRVVGAPMGGWWVVMLNGGYFKAVHFPYIFCHPLGVLSMHPAHHQSTRQS